MIDNGNNYTGAGMRQIASTISSILLVIICTPVFASDRVALVIGISDYQNSIQAMTIGDAKVVAQSLEDADFEVLLKLDLDQEEFGRALLEFEEKLKDAKSAAFYFGGHGVSFGSQNYLLSKNAKVENPFLISQDGFEISTIMHLMSSNASTSIAMIDASRENSFSANLAKSSNDEMGQDSVSVGLAPVAASFPNSMIVFSSAANTVSAASKDELSPFASAIAENFKDTSTDLSVLFKRVTNDVFEATDGRQRPEVVSSMSHEYNLAGSHLNPSSVSADEHDAVFGKILEIAEAQEDQNLREIILAFLSEGYPESATISRSTVMVEYLTTLATNLESSGLLPLDDETKLLEELANQNSGKPEQIEENLNLGRDEYSRIQYLMNSIGFYVGEVDGVFGARSRESLARFQTQVNLERNATSRQVPATGYLSADSIDDLVQWYASTPKTYDGNWRLTISRRNAGQRYPKNSRFIGAYGKYLASVALEYVDGRFEVSGHHYVTWEPENAFGDFSGHVDNNNYATFNGTVSYLFKAPDLDRPRVTSMASRILLPKLVRNGDFYYSSGGKIGTQWELVLILSRN